MEASALSHPVGLRRPSVTGRLLRLRSDEQLVALFRAGHDEAFGVIHDRYRQRLNAYTRQMLGGARSDAEDVLQDVFLRAYHALRADGRPVTLRAWLYRVAHNRCVDQLRRPDPAAADIFDLNRVPQHDPPDALERREDLRRLVADVQRLPEQQRSALLMREMEGLSYTELAVALGVTVPAVKSLLVRARIGLVEAIEARDTACRDIRMDLASAFDRGVRASGRSRRHLRECSGCREYRSAMRHVEKQLNGLSPSSGPLTTLAKILGIGGASSGAAASGGAAAGGGSAGLATLGATGGGAATTIGAGAATATAGKVAAVVAAAAMVSGGAATVEKRVADHVSPAPQAKVAPAPVRSAAATTALARHAATTSLADNGALRVRHAAPTPVDATSTVVIDPVTSIDDVAAGDDPAAITPATPEDVATGGLRAPDDTAPDDPAADGTTTGAGGTGTTGLGAATTNQTASTTGTSSGTSTSGTVSSSTSAGTTGSGGTTTASTGSSTGSGSAGGSTGTSGPTGQTSTSSDGAPVAQGASFGAR